MVYRDVFKSRFWIKAVIVFAILPSFVISADAIEAMETPKCIFNVRDYGATGNGVTLDTRAIQTAVNACSKAGGGTVYFPTGTYLSGTIFLDSNVTLFIDTGAILLGSTDLKDYPVTVPSYRSYTDNYTDKSLIYGEDLRNISIIGRGVIDGQGDAFSGQYKVRPYMIRIIECQNITIRDITIRNSPMWVQHYLACENVNIDGITVHSKVNHNNDGIDIDSCEKVRISNCEINSGDDAIVLKSTSDRFCRDVTITNCVLSSRCNALKLGTESNGGFQNITITNCTIYDTGLCGIALELVDGGAFNQVNVSNITMNNVNGAIFIRLGNRARPFKNGMEKPGMGSLRNVIISNVQATNVDSIGCSITGLPGHPVENVLLENVRINFRGGGTQKDGHLEIPELPDRYPEYKMFGTLPAYGFYCRHVNNLKFHHVELGFEKPDHRSAIVCDDVKDLELMGFDSESTGKTKTLIRLKQVDGAFIHDCRPRCKTKTFISLEGDLTDNITLINNDFSNVNQVIERSGEVTEKALFIKNNRE